MKRNVLISSLICLCCLSACGNIVNNDGYVYEELVNYTDSGTLKFDANNNVVFENVEINFRTICDSDDAKGLQAITEKFNQEYQGKIKVNFAREGQGSFYKTLSQQISQDSGVPDLAMFHNQNLVSMQFSHMFQPIDRIFEMANIDFDINDYYEGTTKNCFLGEHQYGLPIDAHTEIIIYRKDLLKKYNLDVPANFYDFVDAATMIQNGERKLIPAFNGIAMSTESFGTTQYAFYSALFQNGFEFCNEETYMPEWENESNKTALKNACELFKGFYYGDGKLAKPGTEELSSEREFASGETAFSLIYPWKLSSISSTYVAANESKGATYDDIGVMPLSKLFTLDDTTEYSDDLFGISHCFAVPKTIIDVNKKAAAMFFAKYISEKSVEWTSYGHVPMNKDLYASDEFKNAEYTQKYLQYYGEAEDYRNFPSTPFYTACNDALQQIIVEVLGEEESDIDSIISQYSQQVISRINSQIAF